MRKEIQTSKPSGALDILFLPGFKDFFFPELQNDKVQVSPFFKIVVKTIIIAIACD